MRGFTFFLLAALLAITGCGNPGVGTKDSSLSPGIPATGTPTPFTPNPFGASAPYSPGSYFKVIKEVGNAKDTRVIEFQYLSSGKFIVTQTSFMAGDLTKAYYQKKVGTYTEQLGNFTHLPNYDSCNDLARVSTYVSGHRSTSVNINWKGNSSVFYSYATNTLPSDISFNIIDAIEDVGCKIFQN